MKRGKERKAVQKKFSKNIFHPKQANDYQYYLKVINLRKFFNATCRKSTAPPDKDLLNALLTISWHKHADS